MTTPANALPPALDKMVQRFKRASDSKRRYEQLLWLAKKLPEFPDSEKVPDNKVQGCVSQVYVIAHLDDEGKVLFEGDSDAQLTKGLLAFLIRGTNGLTPEEVVKLAPDFIEETGLRTSLTPSRANGFYNIFKTMKQKALLLASSEISNAEAN
ncbi:SufE family protein [Baaleninema simplex]|uniref:SufE family protein n=1 Tax=Baaleninema simplex TaxID=2862350 RepID=UPI00034A52ED|nr:SufE family protein [Baaleninema simplex]